MKQRISSRLILDETNEHDFRVELKLDLILMINHSHTGQSIIDLTYGYIQNLPMFNPQREDIQTPCICILHPKLTVQLELPKYQGLRMSLVNYEDIYEEFLLLSSSSPGQCSHSGNKSKNQIKTNSCQSSAFENFQEFPVSIQINSPKDTSSNCDSLPSSPNSINFSILKMGGDDLSNGVTTAAPTLGDTVDNGIVPPLNSSVICERLEDNRQQYGEKRSDPSSSNISDSMSNNNGSPPNKRVAVELNPSIPSLTSSVSNIDNNDHCQTNLSIDTVESMQHQRPPMSNDGLQQCNNRQQHPYYPYPSDFQYPSPHFLTGGCIQQTALLPSHMHHTTGWNLGQNHPMSDHNYVGISTQQNNQNNLMHQQQQYNGIGGQQFSLPAFQNNATPSSQLIGNNQMSLTNQMVSNNRSSWTLNAESVYPGGLEVLWREVPEECQKLMTVQDVPDTARFRGYFTVCELISLKRNLMARLSCNGNKGDQMNHSNEVAVGMAVKEAMNTLQDDDQQNSENNNSKPDYCTANVPLKPSQCVVVDTPVSIGSGPITQVANAGNVCSNPQVGMNNPMGPPPPYRTATLVFKLLQIGNYQFRSFSEVNPNRLRVLFNTQRLTYECQLSVVRPPRDGMQPLRKLLTVDIGFDQISMIRFGTDKLFLRVEGAPLLTVTYNPANEDSTCPPLSQQDHQLLEQIDKGQLKLSPCHQLYFLNERLVHLLEAQFREHPRFRHILQNTFNQPSHIMQQPVSTTTTAP